MAGDVEGDCGVKCRGDLPSVFLTDTPGDTISWGEDWSGVSCPGCSSSSSSSSCRWRGRMDRIPPSTSSCLGSESWFCVVNHITSVGQFGVFDSVFPVD